MNLIEALKASPRHETRRKGWGNKMVAYFCSGIRGKRIEIIIRAVGIEHDSTEDQWLADD